MSGRSGFLQPSEQAKCAFFSLCYLFPKGELGHAYADFIPLSDGLDQLHDPEKRQI
jgi:hypothetical protein